MVRRRKRLTTQCPIGQSIRDARLRRNMTQAELAGRMGFTQTVISRYEIGDATMESKLEFVKAVEVVIPEVIDILAARYDLLTLDLPRVNRAIKASLRR